MRPSTYHIDTSDPHFLRWKRLHICIAKLESVNEMTSHMSFFAVLATADLKVNPHERNEPLIIALVITTSLLVLITMVVKFVASNILPSIQSIAELSVIENIIQTSPHEHLIYIINITWIFANIICPCLFAIDFMLLCWIQFELISMKAVFATAGIMMSLLAAFIVFGIIFFKQKIPYKRRRNQHLREILKLVQSVSGISEADYDNSRSGFYNYHTAQRDSISEEKEVSSCSEDEIYTSSSSSSSASSFGIEDFTTSTSTNRGSAEDMRTPLLKKQLLKKNSYGSTALNTFDPVKYFYSSS